MLLYYIKCNSQSWLGFVRVSNVLLNKGEKLPQTVENLQKVMEADAILMASMAAEIKRLTHENGRLRQRLLKKNRGE